MDTKTSTLLITGATAENGIGMALARRFQQRGSTVIVSGRSQRRLDELSATHPELDTIYLDVTNPDSIAAASASLRETHPELDTVMTMAGMMAPENVLDPASLATAEDIIVTNLLGTIRTIRAFLPNLLEQPAATIITVGSGLGFVPRADVPSYSASKAAVRFYTDAIRMQLADTGVQVKLLAPPAVRNSGIHRTASAESGKRASAQKAIHHRTDLATVGQPGSRAERVSIVEGQANSENTWSRDRICPQAVADSAVAGLKIVAPSVRERNSAIQMSCSRCSPNPEETSPSTSTSALARPALAGSVGLS